MPRFFQGADVEAAGTRPAGIAGGVVSAGKTRDRIDEENDIATDLDEAFRRVEEYCLPLEDQRALHVYGEHSGVNMLLVVNKETPPSATKRPPGRIHVVLVKEPLGV